MIRIIFDMRTVKETIDEAVKVLKSGGVILYPTDTIWGIGCDACNEKAVEKVFEIKHRPESKSLVLLACDLDMVAKYVKNIPSIAVDLVEVNDAPMTLIYPEGQYLARNVMAEDGSVGIRIPFVEEGMKENNSPAAFCKELTRRFQKPIVSTSANISGEPSPKTFDDISEEIITAVDYCVPKELGKGGSGKASQIIKVGLKGEVEIIRG